MNLSDNQCMECEALMRFLVKVGEWPRTNGMKDVVRGYVKEGKDKAFQILRIYNWSTDGKWDGFVGDAERLFKEWEKEKDFLMLDLILEEANSKGRDMREGQSK